VPTLSTPLKVCTMEPDAPIRTTAETLRANDSKPFASRIGHPRFRRATKGSAPSRKGSAAARKTRQTCSINLVQAS
jgi:hypothetical protein